LEVCGAGAPPILDLSNKGVLNEEVMAALCAVACAVIVGCTLTMTQKIAIARQLVLPVP
jgi:hypothetical protein